MKKFLLFVVLLAILAGVGYGAWWFMQQQGSEGASEPVSEPVAGEPAEPATPEPEPAPAGPTQFDIVGCELDAAAGWAVDETAQEGSIVPGGQAVVLRKGASGQPPFMVLGKLTAEALGDRDPARYPSTFIAELRSRFNKLQPAPKITASGAPRELPGLFISAQELLAEGDFSRLGLATGSARFLAGVTADKQVVLVAAFTAAGSAEETEVDGMIASLKPLAKPEAEAAPAPEAGAAPAESDASPAEPATSEAPPAAEPASDQPAAEASPAPAATEPKPAEAKPAEKPATEGEAKPEAKPTEDL